MRLIEVAEPILRHTCALMRGAACEPGSLKPDVKSAAQRMDELFTRAAADAAEAGVRAQWERAELPLLYFVDDRLTPIYSDWPGLAERRRKQLAGADDFFAQVELLLAEHERSPKATDHTAAPLQLALTCMCLGFRGAAEGPDKSRDRRARVAAALGLRMGDPGRALFPDPTMHEPRRDNLRAPQVKQMWGLVQWAFLVAVFFFLVGLTLFLVKAHLFRTRLESARIAQAPQPHAVMVVGGLS